MDNEKIKSNITSADHWIRLLFMILFALILYVAGFVVGLLVLVQFLFALITGKCNSNLRQLGDSLTQFVAQTLRFLTYNSDDKPFPFADWPTPAPIVETVEPEDLDTADSSPTAQHSSEPTAEAAPAESAEPYAAEPLDDEPGNPSKL